MPATMEQLLRLGGQLVTAFGYLDDAGNRQVLVRVARVLKFGGRFDLEVQHRDRMVDACSRRRAGAQG